ncbi:MAG: ABC transporter ATP-binding protein [Solirubrobacterales bacterium]
MAGAIVEVRGLSKHYGDGATRVDALKAIDLDITAGTVVGLLGPSGSGKSTLLGCIGGIVDPSAGVMALDGETVFDGGWRRTDLRRMRLEKIGFIFQFHNLIPFLTVSENIEVVLTLAGWPRAKASARARELLDYLQVGEKATAMPAQLSGGQAQRVAIARALANTPRLILADEPTAALDGERAAIVMGLLRKVAAEQQAAVVVVTHDHKVMAQFDAVHVLEDGRLARTEVPA